ncbi:MULTISPECIES: electron transport complex subunit RsxB [Shewanella]|uniref:Ion-translocating oxidoreductase complex subunit B n=1 Tax=Shewanella japonica TaxID=93973 RepID=A0ABN4YGT8_9GAMM|nr:MULTISPECIES: electron transport complex subunit RsxB [Shewanella]ARD22185.1 Electron transport complex subunit B [Shewanella japonica]KPZ68544.1 Electron transport complex protein rnfB [Shewanella sp. P1-14-1]
MSSIVIAVIVLTVLALIFGLILGYASIKFKVEGNPIVEQVEALLPQTQCGQCGYPGCRPYAEAIANGDNVNKCPPGGTATMEKIASLMGVDPEPLNEVAQENIKKVAFIREDECIGCTKCIQACPVDAILGAGKLMHTVIAKDCTGCDLCVEPCPVDCIDMIPVEQNLKNWDWKLSRIPVTIVEGVQSPNREVKEESQC